MPYTKYHPTTCPHCGADLTRPDSIDLHLSTGAHEFDELSSVDATGRLMDVAGQVALGLHAGSWCRACGTLLDELEER